MSDKNAIPMAGLYKVLQIMAEELDRDATLLQVMAFTRIAMAGSEGADIGKMQDELKVASATISRVVQALSALHYLKDREGYNLVERTIAPGDNRRRVVRLTPKGEKAVARLAALIAKL